MKKKGQVELPFNWIYILIAGAVILLFFVGLVVRQVKVSEEKLSIEVTNILGSIFAGAGVSEKTKNFIDASGLADYIIYFNCDEAVSEFGISGKPARTQNSVDPLFSPKEIQSHTIITWSLPYKLPFKVIDFLIVTSISEKYYLLGGDVSFINEFLNATEGFSREYVSDLNSIKAEGTARIRLVDVDGSIIPAAGIPKNLASLEDRKVSAVVFSGNKVDYYQKKGSSWEKLNKVSLNLVSLGGERDAAKYAAIFAGDDQIYWCNMQKAFKRLGILAEVYGGNEIEKMKSGGKLGEMVDYYKMHPDRSGECLGYLENYNDNARDALAVLANKASACRLEDSSCPELVSSANNLKQINEQLRLNCITIY